MRVLKRHSGGGNVLHFDGSISLAKNSEELQLSYWEPDYMQWTYMGW